jgi:hypothetical protein
MCFYCSEWWPLNALGRAALGLDADTPYWLHGVWLNDLSEACAAALMADPRNALDAPWAAKVASDPKVVLTSAGARAAFEWLRARNPAFGDIVYKLVPHSLHIPDYLQVIDACSCELPRAFTIPNRYRCLEQAPVLETRSPPEFTGWYGQLLDDCRSEPEVLARDRDRRWLEVVWCSPELPQDLLGLVAKLMELAELAAYEAKAEVKLWPCGMNHLVVPSPLKRGRVRLDRATADRPDLYDPLYYLDTPTPGVDQALGPGV